MSDDRERREKLLALERQAEVLRQTVQCLKGELSLQEERWALAAKASNELTADLARQAERRAALQVTLRRLHDLVYARLLRGGASTVIDEIVDELENREKQSRQNE